MSHFTEVKTKIKNKETLKKALLQMGHQVVEGVEEERVEVRGYFGETQVADFKILTTSNYDIGFRLNNEGNYEVVGDWELLPKVSGIQQEAFTKRLKREYARESILSISEKMGYSVEYLAQVNSSETVEILVKQWG